VLKEEEILGIEPEEGEKEKSEKRSKGEEEEEEKEEEQEEEKKKEEKKEEVEEKKEKEENEEEQEKVPLIQHKKRSMSRFTNQINIGRNKVEVENENIVNEEVDPRLGTKLQAPSDFDGPTDKRSRTDIFFAILLVIMWVCLTALGVHGIDKGDYRLFIHPMDYDGNICGLRRSNDTVDVGDYPNFIYINEFGGGVCIKECPNLRDSESNANLTDAEKLVDIHTWITYDGVWQDVNSSNWLNKSYISIANYSTVGTNNHKCNEDLCDTTESGKDGKLLSPYYGDAINEGKGYAYYAVDTFEFAFGRCIDNPKATQELKNQLNIPEDTFIDIDHYDDAVNVWNHVFADSFEARWYIVVFGICGSVVAGLTYSLVLRTKCLLSFIIWGSIFSILALLFGTGYYVYNLQSNWDKDEPQEHNDSTIMAAKVISIILFVLGGLFFVVLVFIRRSIMLAIACVKESARSIGAMPLIVLFPLLQCAGFLAFIVIWGYYAISIASTGDMTTWELPTGSTASVRSWSYNDSLQNMGWFLLFAFFWTGAFIVHIGDIIIAHCVSTWYFTRDKSTIGSSIVPRSMCSMIRYHTGTAAFGSMILAFVQLVRCFISYIQKLARKWDNKAGEALLCCFQCCLLCFQKFLEFISKNAYIQTAIFGTSFCVSTREAFSLILRNAIRMGSIAYVTEIVLIIGRLFISALVVCLGYIYMESEIGNEVVSLAGPCVLILLLAYFISSMFLHLFNIATSTILQCFIADEEMFEGNQRYAEGDLGDFIDKFEEIEKKSIKVGN